MTFGLGEPMMQRTPSTGPFTVDGGMGVQKNIYTGGNIVAGGRISGKSREVSTSTTLDDDHVVSVTATATLTFTTPPHHHLFP